MSQQNNKFKDSLKNIPILGWLFRWTYNLLRLNNIKHNLYVTQNNYKNLELKYKDLDSQIEKRFNKQNEIAFDLVRTQIVNQSILFHQKIDAFISSIDIKTESLENLKSKNHEDFLHQLYFDFENKFRGSRDAILKRYESYLKYLPKEIEKSLDIGCGRAEWVQLLQAKNIDAYGIDQNSAMLEIALENNVKNLKSIDAFEYLLSCEENYYDLITAFHIIEHLSYMDLINLLLQIRKVAKNNATVLLETPNPANMLVSTNNFYLDPTHKNPIPSAYMKFLLEYLGFEDVEVYIINPMNDSKLLKEESQSAKLINHHFYQGQDYLIKAKNKK